MMAARQTDLNSHDAFKKIADAVLSAAKADHTSVSLSDSRSATTRFANNQVTQNVSVRRSSVTVHAAFGQQVGAYRTTRLDPAGLREAVERAEAIAWVSPPDPEYLPPLPKQSYLKIDTFCDSTAGLDPTRSAELIRPVIARCEENGLNGAGIVEYTASAVGLAASTGLMAFEHRTDAEFSLTATGQDSSGWVLNAHRDIDLLDIERLAGRAIAKALASRNPRQVEPGRYTVLLEPAAVAGFSGPLLWSTSAKSYEKGNSPYIGKLGTQVIDSRLTIRTDPQHPSLLGAAFDRQGLPRRPSVWFDKGVLKQLWYDRFTAKKAGVEPTPFPAAVVMEPAAPVAGSVDELIAQTDRGILVTNFWYIRSVNPKDMTITGMTRDGTFLIEGGKIACGVRNFRFHDSPLRALANIDAATAPADAMSMERGKSLLPALKLPDFNFSSVTRF